MNTRVQVEHCVTEAVTGIDIVREQIQIAAGEPLSFGQDDIALARARDRGRINAEDASTDSRPRRARSRTTASRRGRACGWTRGFGGSEITPLYDPMVAKLIVWDADRRARPAGCSER